MTKLVTDLKPQQLILTKSGSQKVGFYDKICEIDVIKDDKGRIISSKKVPKLYIHIEIPSDPTTVVDRPAKEQRIIDINNDHEVKYVHETELYSRAYEKYLEAKNSNESNPYEEIEELKKKLAEKENEAAKFNSEPKEIITKSQRKINNDAS